MSAETAESLSRDSFMRKLQTRLERDTSQARPLFLFYIGLDGFKAVNDCWGYALADRVLDHALQSVQQGLRASDRVARFGSDELAALVHPADGESIDAVCEKILTCLRRPLNASGRSIVVTGSVGALDAGHRGDATDMVRLTAQAMLAAKRAGRDIYHVFRNDIDIPDRGRAELATDLRGALTSGALRLVYQPQFDVHDGRLVGAEALVRWRHPERGDIRPDVLIALAEECGIIRTLTAWSLETAVAALAEWAPRLGPDFRLSVNVSPAQMLATGFAERISTLVERYAVDVRRLRLEVTEHIFLHENAVAHLERLRVGGVSLALDDFGTGYSSLAQLARLPIDTLKVDQAFVQQLSDQRVAIITRNIIAMGDTLGLTVIAEGIETQAQADRLREFGCAYVQGFLYARPEEETDFTRRLADPATIPP